MSKFYGYVRGNEVGFQIKSINEYAVENDFRLENNFVKITNLINILEDGDTVVIYKCDRLARNIYEYIEIENKINSKGATISFVTN